MPEWSLTQGKRIAISILLISVMLAFVSCNRNDPVGGDFIDERAGDVVCDTLRSFTHKQIHEPFATGTSEFLYAGNEINFKSIILLSFERPLTKAYYDSVLFLFSVESKGAEGLYLTHFLGEFYEDSIITWQDVDSHIGDILSNSAVWIEDTVSGKTILRFSLKEVTLPDTIDIALCSDGETSVFYSNNSENPPIIKLFRGPLLEIVKPFKDAFIDTILEYDTTEIFIATGSYVWKDTVFLSDSLVDFTEVSTVNNAILFLPINNPPSGPNPELCVRYKDNLSIPYIIEGDTLKMEVTRFVDEWITDEDRFIVLEGKEGTLFTVEISKNIMLDVVYTKKPGDRI